MKFEDAHCSCKDKAISRTYLEFKNCQLMTQEALHKKAETITRKRSCPGLNLPFSSRQHNVISDLVTSKGCTFTYVFNENEMGESVRIS